MANGKHGTKLGGCISILILLSHILSNGFVDGKRIATLKIKDLVKHEGTVKTIRTKDDDVIDCVHIYNQPAFDHPLLKNHTLQIKPSSYPFGLKEEKFGAELLQGWLKDEQCPEGTIPIRRTQIVNTHHHAMPSVPQKITNEVVFNAPPGHEYALVSMFGDNYYGAQAIINVWNPATYDQEFSVAQIWVVSGDGKNLNSIEAGWIVESGDNQPRFFIYWTKDGYHDTGCYNLDCPGFVQTSNKHLLGAAIRPVSTYGAKQFEIDIKIHKDQRSGNWWLQVQGQALGYWPSTIFSGLAESSTAIGWGGEVLDKKTHGHHTSTHMGSGHLPTEGYGKASYFRNLGYIDNSGIVKNARNLVPYVPKPSCYDLQVINKVNSFGVHFYFGGPGYSQKCQ